MKRELMLILLLLPINIFAQITNKAYYPLNEKDRGLILPKGTFEFAIGPAYMTGRKNNVQAFMGFRYSLFKNFELTLLGLKYRFINKSDFQSAIIIQNYGISNPFSKSFFHHTKLEITTKYTSTTFYALKFSAGYYFASAHESEGETDGKSNEARFVLSMPLRLSNTTSLTLVGGYRFISYENYSRKKAFFSKINFSQNVFNFLDIVLETRYSNFSKPTDSVLFNESYHWLYAFIMRFRF